MSHGPAEPPRHSCGPTLARLPRRTHPTATAISVSENESPGTLHPPSLPDQPDQTPPRWHLDSGPVPAEAGDRRGGLRGPHPGPGGHCGGSLRSAIHSLPLAPAGSPVSLNNSWSHCPTWHVTMPIPAWAPGTTLCDSTLPLKFAGHCRGQGWLGTGAQPHLPGE